MTTVRDAAITWASRGACVLPTRPDGSKSPTVKWRHYGWAEGLEVPSPPSVADVAATFTDDSTGLGLILGAVSGNLEMLELEGRAVDEGLLGRFRLLAADNGLTDVWQRLVDGYVERTPSGGIHFIYRITDGRALNNIALAKRPSTPEELAYNPDQKIRVLIETRGEGGHVVIAPSHGPTHDSGKPWVVTKDNEPAELTAAERDQLFDVARMLNSIEPPQRPRATAWKEHGDTPDNPFARRLGPISPMDDFEERTDWADILEPAGWQHVTTEGDADYWMRPGKDLKQKGAWGHSASTNFGDDGANLFYCWSTSTPFEPGQWYTKAHTYAVLYHGGDRTAAAQALMEQGYGTPRRQPSEGDPEFDAQNEQRCKEQDSRGYWIPDELWDNPEFSAFGHLRRAAWSRQAIPDAVLLAAMIETVARVGPQVVIPPWIGSQASLNLGGIIVADAGDGKSISVSVARDVIAFGDHHRQSIATFLRPMHTFCPSTPQGIAAQYQKFEAIPNAQPGLVRKEVTAMCDVDEGDQLQGSWKNHGIGLIAEFRKALMGKTIGFGNVGDTKTNLPGHAYRFSMIICTLTEHTEWILSDDVGGFPQRLVWACAEDARDFGNPEWPGQYIVPMPPGTMCGDPSDGGAGSWTNRFPVFELTADDKVRDEVISQHKRRRMLGLEAGSLDGHATLTREKVAWIFALMHGRTHVRYDHEWNMAGLFMKSSNAARSYAQSKVSEKAALKAHHVAIGRGKSRATEELTSQEQKEAQWRSAVTRRVVGYLTATPGMTKNDIRKKFNKEPHLRELLGDKGNPQVLDALIQSGQIRYENITQGETIVGSRWFLATSNQEAANPFA